MKMIDKYVYAVVKNLPENSREDVEKELRSNIEDMLPEGYTEDDVRAVLLELGNPFELASEYQDTKRYLISPAMYNHYILVLKTVACIVACVLPIIAIITVITEAQNASITQVVVNIFLQLFVMTIETAFQVFAWVTIIFAMLDRISGFELKWPFTGKAWTPDDLENVPDNKFNSIPRSEPIAEMIFSVLFLFVLNSAPSLIGLYSFNMESGVSKLSITPLFNADVLYSYMPFVVGLTVFMVVLSILKLIYQKWNIRLAVINAIYHAVSIVFIWLFFSNENLFNNAFIKIFSEIVKTPPETFAKLWQWSMNGFIALLVLLFVWESINGFLKVKKLGIHSLK